MQINIKKKRSLFAIAFLCLVVLVGITIAYLQSTDTFENIFSAGTYKTITTEEFVSPTNWLPGDEITKIVVTRNEGTIPIRVRVTLDESWTSPSGNDLPLRSSSVSGSGNVAIINFDNQNYWVNMPDTNTYYYTLELAPGESTKSLIKSVTFNPNYKGTVTCTTSNDGKTNTCESSNDSYDGGTYRLKIITETVQADKYREVWGGGVPAFYDYVGDNPCTYNGELVDDAQYVNGGYTYTYRPSKRLGFG